MTPLLLCAIFLASLGFAVFASSGLTHFGHYVRELKQRTPITTCEFQSQYLADVPLDIVEKLLAIVEDQFGEDRRLVRPSDNHFLINDDLDLSTFLAAIEHAFEFSFTEDELELLCGTHGELGELARQIAKNCVRPKKTERSVPTHR